MYVYIKTMNCHQEKALAPTRACRNRKQNPSSAVWTEEEKKLLINLMNTEIRGNWKKIAEYFINKTPQQCAEQWTKVLNPIIKKGSWTFEEDEILRREAENLKNNGKNWSYISTFLPGRTGKQCRERWMDHLDPNLNKGPWSEIEDQQLISFQKIYGNKWAEIAKRMPGRSQNNIKNRWNNNVKKRLPEQPSVSLYTTPVSNRSHVIETPDSIPNDFPKPEIESLNYSTETGYYDSPPEEILLTPFNFDFNFSFSSPTFLPTPRNDHKHFGDQTDHQESR
ncbi:Myb-like DNA-binding domain containing protein [Histomonas meleagridis]|uniref:Myb-like DNA-binding domain containing protein n=1 Tax=Histomonas meleagridis TaxID=135588 RepID=UPI00355AC6C7|nr:Myb-like DNA-binding domain containing protein [Histomonas meleagridis]KAH0803978.1 Myb-like DNA-binding domain containing protein [Histomonas meleagridis]